MLRTHIPVLPYVPIAVREQWTNRLISVLLGLVSHPTAYTLFRYFAYTRCTLYLGRRGGRKYSRDLAHELGHRLELWDVDDIPSLYSTFHQARRSVRLQGRQISETVLRRVERFLSDGDCSKACGALSARPPLEPTEELLHSLKTLHPESQYLVDPAIIPGLENLTAFTVDEVTVALRSFKKSSSAGPSRMRPCHILNLFQAKTANRLFTVLGSLTTKLANYGFPSSLSPLLCGASLFALEKPAGGIRPIACGDLLRRLTSKLVYPEFYL